MGPLNRNAAFRRQGTTRPGPSSCRLKAAFRDGFMENPQRTATRYKGAESAGSSKALVLSGRLSHTK